jgi:hypothetical protein
MTRSPQTGTSRRRTLRRAAVPAGAVIVAAAGCTLPPPGHAPRGSFDAVTAVNTTPTGVMVSGWVDDEDAPGPSNVRIAVDGVTQVVVPADIDRPDVASFVAGAKVRTGFNVYVPAAVGSHTVCVWAVNTGGIEPDSGLGCRWSAVGSGADRGSPGSYSFMLANPDQSPAKWNGCQDIHYVTRTGTAYPGAVDDINVALAAVRAESGLRFVYDGEVATVPTVSYGTGAPVGGKYQPLLVGFATAAESDLFNGQSSSVIGMAGPTVVSVGGRYVYVSGRVALEKDRLATMPRRGAYSITEVIMHEVGHAVGLGHVSDPSQLMNPYIVNYEDWGAGDRAGLHALSTPLCGLARSLDAGDPAVSGPIAAS